MLRPFGAFLAWSPFLAQASADPMSHGQSALIGGLFILCLAGFSVYSIIKAFTFRTTAWIVAAGIGSLFLALILTAFAAGLFRAISADRSPAASTEPSDSTLQAAPRDDPSPEHAATRIVGGQDLAYSLEVPVAWTTTKHKDAFDTLNSYKSLYVGVIAEEAEIGSPQTIADIARKKISKVGTEIAWSDPVPLTLDGREWLEFRVECKFDEMPISYRFFVYSGQEGTFQVVGWTARNLIDRDASLMRQVMQTFRFPK